MHRSWDASGTSRTAVGLRNAHLRDVLVTGLRHHVWQAAYVRDHAVVQYDAKARKAGVLWDGVAVGCTSSL
jgi:hypothetical protein